MAENHPCVICGDEQAEKLDDSTLASIHQRCPRCGEFWWGDSTPPIPQETQVKLSAWIREQNMLNEIPKIDGDQIKRIDAMPIPRHLERADRILIHVVRHQKSLNEVRINGISPGFQEIQAISYSKDPGELGHLLKLLEDQGFFAETLMGMAYRITSQGHKRYAELHALGAASTQAFVAMWFDDSMQDAYENGLKAGILKAGYDPMRIDDVEHAGKIDDRTIAEIRRSKFLVADFTGHRGGVYFEAGFAFGLNLQVIWTCHKDHIKNLHFDIRQYNCIDWTEPTELAERLENRIGAVIGMGPRNLFSQE